VHTPGTPRPHHEQRAASGNGKTSLDLIEDDYTIGAIDKENANRYRSYAVFAPEKLPQKYRSTVVGKDAAESMVRQALDWDGLSKSTQQEILDLRANGFANLKNTLKTEHFVLHYSTVSTSDAVPAVDANRNGVPDYVEVAAQSWEQIWQRQVVELAYPAPKGASRDNKFHVYYDKLSYYGYCMPTNVELLRVSPVPYGNREPNRAPWGLGANFVDFTNASGSLTMTVDGTDSFAWRAYVVATPAKGDKAVSILPIVLDGGSAGSITVDGMGSRWSKLTLVVTIADRAGAAVPYSYGATVSRTGTIAN
jgi:hypothetical protein